MALPELLSTLTESLSSALDSLPTSTDVALPEDGISLLSTKNELLLSYLQNLVFLIILKIRNLISHPSMSSLSKPQSASSLTSSTIDNLTTHDALVVQNLVALRVYLEKGIRPLESRLQYQLSKLLAAADEAARVVSGPAVANVDLVPATDQTLNQASSPTSDANGDNNNDSTLSQKIDPLSHRPNPASLFSARRRSPPTSSSKQGIYRPPHITPTSLPPLAPPSSKKTHRAAAARKSATLDEFVREEMTDAPTAEPSIGAGNGLRGRAAERERERTGYEEGRLVRLPAEKGGGARAAAGKKRGGGTAEAEDFLLGGGGRWDRGDLLGLGSGGGGMRKKQKVRREGSSREVGGLTIGEKWQQRKRMAARGKRR